MYRRSLQKSRGIERAFTFCKSVKVKQTKRSELRRGGCVGGTQADIKTYKINQPKVKEPNITLDEIQKNICLYF